MVNWLSCLEFLFIILRHETLLPQNKEKSILVLPILHYFLCQLSTKIGETICIYYSTAQPFPIAVFRHKIMKISIVIIVVYYTCYKSSMNPMLWCLTLEQ